MRAIHYVDFLERDLGNALTSAGIEFIHESEAKGQELDFFLPDYNIYIEVKQYHSPRIERQMAQHDNVIVLQGRKSVSLLCSLLKP